MDKVERQIAAEEFRRSEAENLGIEQVKKAIQTGRYVDMPEGRVILARAHIQCVEALKLELEKKTRGIGGKYRNLLRGIDPDVLMVVGLRTMLTCGVERTPGFENRVQSILNQMGKAIEAEALIHAIDVAAAPYLQRTLQYLDAGHTQSLSHRYRTLRVAADRTIGGWEPWSGEERTSTARILFEIIMETGLFVVEAGLGRGGKETRTLIPSPVLAQHFDDVVEHARAILSPEPMIVPPVPWTGYASGGYITPWMQARSVAVGIHASTTEQREWVIENFNKATTLHAAMNKAQSVAYRVNHRVFDVFQQALAVPEGILGLPAHGEQRAPVFPFGEGWEKDSASQEELDAFTNWKDEMRLYYSKSAKLTAKKNALAASARVFRKYHDEEELYFVTYLDSRGRLYFRGAVQPQGSDAVKGCLEFSHGHALGQDGLFWLKAHVASCAGFDKADFPLRVQWTDENWERIQAWLEDPLASDPDEPSTAFTFLAAALALQEALSLANPDEYVCHIPVAMDATCSGLQHFSALMRDPEGGRYTNLIDAEGDQKSDIYKRVGALAAETVKFPDANYAQFWASREISRSMAKRPTMTYCYSATLQSNIDYVVEALMDDGAGPIKDEHGKTIMSLYKLAVPVAKALRAGVESSVPAAAAIMRHLQRLVRVTDEPLRWITPAGMPVLNWTPKEIIRTLDIRALGVSQILYKRKTKEYDSISACSSIAPNFVHSMDSAHLCRVIARSNFPIMPIHDSFACLPHEVTKMHEILRDEFVLMYSAGDPLAMLEQGQLKAGKELPERPPQGTLDLAEIRRSRFTFC